MARNVALLSHDRNPDVIESARRVARALTEAHVEVTWLPTVPWDTAEDDTIAPLQADLSGVDLVVVIGGDGTILRAAELTYGLDLPILGINYGHMGFWRKLTRNRWIM